MKLKTTLAAALLTLSAAGSAFADAIPYPDSGTQNPVTYTFTAPADGAITAYFLGSHASYDEVLGMTVNGTATGVIGLDNHNSNWGQSLVLGSVHAGDILTFYIHVLSTGDTWSSDSSLNADGHSNHVYSTSFSGATVDPVTVPAGTFVAFEDLPAGGSDYNYQDEQFAFTNVGSTPSIPEPANMALLMAGLGLVGLVARRRRG